MLWMRTWPSTVAEAMNGSSREPMARPTTVDAGLWPSGAANSTSPDRLNIQRLPLASAAATRRGEPW
eukprot:scaffold19436_cov152-Isochrysis_galbana.AAC.2